MPDTIENRIKQALATDPDRWMTVAEIMRHMYGPQPLNEQAKAAYSNSANTVSSQAFRMMEAGTVVGKDSVGPRGGRGYQLSDNEKNKLRPSVSRFNLIQEDPFT